MRKIMWVCNTPLPEIQLKFGAKVCGESWLQGISDQLRKREDIEFHYVFPQGKSRILFKEHMNNIFFWGFYSNPGMVYEPSPDRKRIIGKLIREISPDIIHIFGTELAHSLECMQAAPRGAKLIVSTQGLISELAKVYTKKIPVMEQVLHAWQPGSLLDEKYEFYKRGVNERALLKEVPNVIGRTAWDKQCVRRLNPNCRYFYCSETLRGAFYEGRWNIDNIERHSIYISKADYTIKGFHVFIEALGNVVKSFPDTHVYVAGRKVFLQPGSEYGRYINKLMEKYEVKNRIKFLGVLPAEKVRERLLNTHITVMPSLLENSPNSIGEALLLGTPVVAARVGGIPSLVRNEKEALLYSNHSAKKLAECIIHVFSDDNVACTLSHNGCRRAAKLYNRDTNLEQLLGIYDTIVEERV